MSSKVDPGRHNRLGAHTSDLSPISRNHRNWKRKANSSIPEISPSKDLDARVDIDKLNNRKTALFDDSFNVMSSQRSVRPLVPKSPAKLIERGKENNGRPSPSGGAHHKTSGKHSRSGHVDKNAQPGVSANVQPGTRHLRSNKTQEQSIAPRPRPRVRSYTTSSILAPSITRLAPTPLTDRALQSLDSQGYRSSSSSRPLDQWEIMLERSVAIARTNSSRSDLPSTISLPPSPPIATSRPFEYIPTARHRARHSGRKSVTGIAVAAEFERIPSKRMNCSARQNVNRRQHIFLEAVQGSRGCDVGSDSEYMGGDEDDGADEGVRDGWKGRHAMGARVIAGVL